MLAAFAAALLATAAAKPFWYDEYFTLAMAEHPPGGGLLDAMVAAREYNPPLSYIAVWLSEQIAGRGPVGSRLAFVLAGLVTAAAVERWRPGRAWPWAAATLVASGAFRYFIEARPYALWLAGTAIACAAWRADVDRPRPPALGVAFVTLGLLVCTTSHVWGLGSVGAVLLAEAARASRRRELRLGLVAGLAVALLPAVSYPRMIRSSLGVVFHNATYHDGLVDTLREVAGGGLALPGLLVVALAARTLRDTPWAERPDEPLEAWVLLGALAAVPLGISAVSTVTGGAFVARYAIIACIPLAIATGILADAVLGSTTDGRWRAGAAVCVLLAVSTQNPPYTQATLTPLGPLLERATAVDPTAPIVIDDGLAFLHEWHAPSPVAPDRLVYVADPEAAIAYAGTNGVDAALLAAGPALHVENAVWSAARLCAEADGAWLISFPEYRMRWVLPWLRATDAVVEEDAVHPGALYRIRRCGPTATGRSDR